MTPTNFNGANAEFGANQENVNPLPCFYDGKNLVVSRWELTQAERREVLQTGRLFIGQMTFGQALQPILPSVHNPIEVAGAEGVKEKREIKVVKIG